MWTNLQKQLAVRACKAVGIDRSLILRQFHNAHCGDEITSTAKGLTNQDYAEFMAIVERGAGGQILHFTKHYWQTQSIDTNSRLRHRAWHLSQDLEAAGKLAANGVGLAGWIAARVSQGTTDQLAELDYHQLLALTVQLKYYARQNDVPVGD